MVEYIDKTGLFEDFNFKLVVIDALLDKNPSFLAEMEALVKKHSEDYQWYSGAGPIEEVLDYFSKLQIQQEDLDKVTELCFDGGNEIYSYIQPDWDGEDDFFDVKSVKGFEHLKNLELVIYISMVDEEVLEPMKSKGILIE